MTQAIQSISAANVTAHLRMLTETIGVRLAGSAGERAAAAYLVEQAQALGLAVHEESFAVRERAVTSETLELRVDGVWLAFPCSLFSNTPGTGGRPVEAPLCVFEAPAEYARPDLSHLRGKAVLHLGTHIESREHYRRLIAAEPAFLLFVDIRHPGTTALADGMFPAYTQAVGAVPTVNVAFQDAWEWVRRGATAARLTVAGGMRDATSTNVIIDLPGDPDAGLLFVGGHHDTQAASPGADDNGTGVVAVLELARVLAPLPRRRGIRLISFGAEEQLSVGSAAYVRKHRADLQRHGRFMWNCDSFGSFMGWTQLICNGSAAMAEWLAAQFAARGLWTQTPTTITPYADHFPFVVAGVPSVFLYRTNCTSGRFFHHRPDDDLARVSAPLVATLLEASAAVLQDLATRTDLPFPATVDPVFVEPVRRYWDDLFGGWAG